MIKFPKRKNWFQSDHFLWGWYPVSWEGWTVLSLYIGLLLYSSWVLLPHNRLEYVEPSRFLLWLDLLAICFLSLLIIVWATGGRPSKNNQEDDEKHTQNK